jgi:hypothetical protein
MLIDSHVLLYDIQNAGYPDKSFLIGSVAIGSFLTALTVWLFYINSENVAVKKIKIGSVLVTLFSYLWITIFFFSSFKPYHSIIQAQEAGAFHSVEGVIENFKPGGTERGDTVESFSVKGVSFSYSPYIFGPGFRQSNAVGGSLSNGTRVKINYVGKCISRIEVIK